MMITIAAVYAAISIYGLILFLTGFTTLKPEIRKNLSPQEIEVFDEEMTQRQIVGLLLLAVPIFSMMVYLIFYF
jgi:hypothetical protein